MSTSNFFLETVNSMTPEIDDIYHATKNESLTAWGVTQRSLVTASGAASVAIPGWHLAGMAADVGFVINRMGVSSYGVGSILCHNEQGNVLEPEDFAAVLGYWADDEDLRQALKGKSAADLSGKLGLSLGKKVLGKGSAKVVGKVLTKSLLTSSGYMIGRKLGGKGLAKAAAKFSGKFASKSISGFIPFAGPIVGGGVNLWLIDGILGAAEEFYKDKINILKTIDQ